MKKFKHKKIVNVGLIFEILSHNIVQNILKDDKNIDLVKLTKKYFKKNSVLFEEYELYKILYETKCGNSSEALSLIKEVNEFIKKVDQNKLEEKCKEFLFELNSIIPVKDFFKHNVPNYRLYATIQQYIHETRNFSNIDDLKNKQLFENIIIENLVKNKKRKSPEEQFEDIKNNKLDELTYYVIVERFNNRYKDLLPEQKNIINNFILSINDKKKYDSFFRNETKNVSQQIKLLSEKLEENTKAKIKLNFISQKIDSIIAENKIVTNDNILTILQCHDLIDKLKNIN